MVNPKKLREDRPRIRNPRVARGATHARVRHNARARYATIWQFTLVLCIALVLLIGYVVLTSRLTGMNYALSKAEGQRTALQEQTGRLDDNLASLESQERLARLAAQLGMREPEQFALVALPAAPVATPRDARLAFLAPLDAFLGERAPSTGVR